jgi:hypothetical protein
MGIFHWVVGSYKAVAIIIYNVSGSGWALCLAFKLRLFLFAVIKIIVKINSQLFLFLFGTYKEWAVYVKAYQNSG